MYHCYKESKGLEVPKFIEEVRQKERERAEDIAKDIKDIVKQEVEDKYERVDS